MLYLCPRESHILTYTGKGMVLHAIIPNQTIQIMESFIASITIFAGTYAPKNWAFCNGQLLAISTNQALFSLLGTTYGGDGRTTFGLPDFRGRTAVSEGQGPGLSSYDLGQRSGAETVTLTVNNIPPHVHNGNVNYALKADPNDPSETNPDFAFPAKYTGGYAATANGTMQPPTYSATIGNAGGNGPLPILMPYLVLNYIICLYGIFPSRN